MSTVYHCLPLSTISRQGRQWWWVDRACVLLTRTGQKAHANSTFIVWRADPGGQPPAPAAPAQAAQLHAPRTGSAAAICSDHSTQGRRWQRSTAGGSSEVGRGRATLEGVLVPHGARLLPCPRLCVPRTCSQARLTGRRRARRRRLPVRPWRALRMLVRPGRALAGGQSVSGLLPSVRAGFLRRVRRLWRAVQLQRRGTGAALRARRTGIRGRGSRCVRRGRSMRARSPPRWALFKEPWLSAIMRGLKTLEVRRLVGYWPAAVVAACSPHGYDFVACSSGLPRARLRFTHAWIHTQRWLSDARPGAGLRELVA